MNDLPFKRLTPTAMLPTREHELDAGLDLYADKTVFFRGKDIRKISTGVATSIPADHVGLICDRSSLGAQGLKVMGGVIDPGYTGDLIVTLAKMPGSEYATHIKAGERVAQLLILSAPRFQPVEVDHLDETERGNNGFGSTGR